MVQYVNNWEEDGKILTFRWYVAEVEEYGLSSSWSSLVSRPVLAVLRLNRSGTKGPRGEDGCCPLEQIPVEVISLLFRKKGTSFRLTLQDRLTRAKNRRITRGSMEAYERRMMRRLTKYMAYCQYRVAQGQ